MRVCKAPARAARRQAGADRRATLPCMPARTHWARRRGRGARGSTCRPMPWCGSSLCGAAGALEEGLGVAGWRGGGDGCGEWPGGGGEGEIRSGCAPVCRTAFWRRTDALHAQHARGCRGSAEPWHAPQPRPWARRGGGCGRRRASDDGRRQRAPIEASQPLVLPQPTLNRLRSAHAWTAAQGCCTCTACKPAQRPPAPVCSHCWHGITKQPSPPRI